MVGLIVGLFAARAAAVDEDAVNERIPVDVADLEAHWKVDCGGLWTRVSAQALPCDLSSELLRELELCSFIYQPPGAKALSDCPDYRGALDLANQPITDNCVSLRAFITQQRCAPHSRSDQ